MELKRRQGKKIKVDHANMIYIYFLFKVFSKTTMMNISTTGVDLGVGKIDGVTKNMFICGKLSCLVMKYSNRASI